MANSLWKFTAVVGVIGIGVLVVLQAQRGLSGPDHGAYNAPDLPEDAAPEVIGQAEVVATAPAQQTALPGGVGPLPTLPPLPGDAAGSAPGAGQPVTQAAADQPAPFRRNGSPAAATEPAAELPGRATQVAMNQADPFGAAGEPTGTETPFGGPNPFAGDDPAAEPTREPAAGPRPQPVNPPAEFPTPAGPPLPVPEQTSQRTGGQPVPAEPDENVFFGEGPQPSADKPRGDAPPSADVPFDPYEPAPAGTEPAASATPETPAPKPEATMPPAGSPFDGPFGPPPTTAADSADPESKDEPPAEAAESPAGPMLPAPPAETVLEDSFEADPAATATPAAAGPALPPVPENEAKPEDAGPSAGPTPDPISEPAAPVSLPPTTPVVTEPPGRASVEFPQPPGTGTPSNPFETAPATKNAPAAPGAPVITPRFPARPGATPPSVTPAGAVDVPAGSGSPLTPADLAGDGTVTDAALQQSQRPQLTIEKVAPPRAVLGEPMIYEIVVRNAGQSAAHQVVVEDQIPKGAQLTGTIPQAELLDTTLRWKLGELAAGQSRTIKVRVIPTEEGRIGSVAKVNFVAEVAARTEITSPRLSLELTGPPQAALGSALTYNFTITNTGRAAATGVLLRNVLPEGLEHPGGRDLEYEVGSLAAGQSQQVSLTLTAAKPGRMVCRAILTAEGGAQVEKTHATEVRGERLSLERTGPKRRFVGREAEYVNTVTNTTAAKLAGVRVVEQLPAGVQFAAASDGGRFDAATRTVVWEVPELAPQAAVPLTLRVVPQTVGTLASTVTAVEPAGGRAEVRSETAVEGFAALRLNVDEMTDLVEVGQEFTLRFVAHNRGSAPATDVRMEVAIPPELELVKASGASEVRQDGQRLLFAPVPSVADAAGYDVVFKAIRPGVAKIGFQLASAQLVEPLRRDEPVRVVGK
jgi:uncharacterized repeat protein (TIGR01451 family)